MTSEKAKTEHSNPRKTFGKKPKRVRYEANEREYEDAIKEFQHGKEEIPESPVQHWKY